MMDGFDVNALANLLSPPEDADLDSDEDTTHVQSRLGPGDVGPVKKTPKKKEEKSEKKKHSKDIWDDDDVNDGSQYEDIYDKRPQPEYDIVYKQAIGAEDMFLQLGNRTPATASCEEMVVKISLRDTKYADVTLDVKDKFLDCRTSKYKLGLHLPHPVDSKNGKASWDERTSILSITLRLAREYDFVNF